MKMKLSKQTEGKVYWIFFIVMLCYALLRALYIAPLHDETATYFHFIESGQVWGDGALKDANNHVLNSLLGRWSYQLFGTHFFLFRLPSVIAFCCFFWASRILTSELKIGNWGHLGFLALNTVPWIFEYFCYTRGYGMAIGFFMLSLVFLSRYINTFKSKDLALLFLFLLLAVYSNLTYLISTLLVIAYAGVAAVVRIRAFKWQQTVIQGAVLVLFALIIKPLIVFCFDLKNAGALYYGSLDGLWWVTGKTLSRYVLFYDHDWLRYAFVILGFIALVVFISLLSKTNRSKWLQETSSWSVYLVGGNIVAIFFLAKVLKVNYPEDRAAMYLIPLVTLASFAVFSKNRFTKWILAGFALIPISFILHISLHTSVFSPDERMDNDFYTQVKNQLSDDETIAIYPTMQLNYALYERNQGGVLHIGQPQMAFEPYHDIILTKTTYLFPQDHWQKYYRVVAEDRAANYIALERKQKLKPHVLFDSLVKSTNSTSEFIPIYSGKVNKEWLNKIIRFDIRGDIKAENGINGLDLVITSNDSLGTTLRYEYQNLRWYSGTDKGHYSFNFPYLAKRIDARESQIVVYIWNSGKKRVSLTHSHIKASELK